MPRNRRELLTGLPVLVGAVLIAGAPLLAGRELRGHDSAAYLIYAQQVAANVREGIVLPAWASDLNGGFGGPGLVFYPPLVNALHALLPLAGLPLGPGIGFMALAAALLSGLAAWGGLRSSGLGGGALWGAAFYVAAPYRLVDLFERTALAEHWGFVFPPLLLWIGSTPRLTPRRRVALGALAVALLALTNLPLLALFGLAVGFAVLLLPSTRQAAGPLAIAAPLGMAMAAFSIGPQALASDWLRVEIWFSETGAGAFRASTNTLFSSRAMDAAFNRRVSTAMVATLLLGLAAMAVAPAEGRRRRETRVWLALLAAAFVAALGPFGPVWDALPVFSRLQFPWRTAAPLTLAAAALISLLPARRAAALAAAGILLALPYAGTGSVRPPARRPLPAAAAGLLFPDPRAVQEADGADGSWVQRGMWDYWYVPRTAPTAFFAEMTGTPAPQLGPFRSRPATLSSAPEAPVDVLRWGRLDKEVSLSAPAGGDLVWHVLAFPGMSVALDGRPAPLLLHTATGLAAMHVPAGRHVASWRWRPFPPFRAFRTLSAIALAAVLLLLVLPEAARPVQSPSGPADGGGRPEDREHSA